MTSPKAVPQSLARSVSRRRFLSVTALAAGASVLGAQAAGAATAAAAVSTQPLWQASGSDLSDWETVLGDAVYTAPDQAAVSGNDISTVDSGAFSTLVANTARRGVMAHNITFKRVVDTTLFDSVHTVGFQFRLPYLPTVNGWPDNAQTVEGGFFIWDGGATRRDYGLAFQWVLNPWQSNVGTLNIWTGSGWQSTGYLAPDTGWHSARMTLDRRNTAATMTIDGSVQPTALTTTPKASDWGTETAARLQTEIVSLWPGDNAVAPSHRAQFRNWSWTRQAYTD
jgi:hypothetical protein